MVDFSNQFQVPDIVGAFQRGREFALTREQQEQQAQAMNIQNIMNQIRQQREQEVMASQQAIAEGAKTPEERMAAFDPQIAAQLQEQRKQVQERQLQVAGRIALGAKENLAKSKDKNAAWQASLEQAKRSGLDISSLPQTYQPGVEKSLDDVIAQAREVESQVGSKERERQFEEGKRQFGMEYGLRKREQDLRQQQAREQMMLQRQEMAMRASAAKQAKDEGQDVIATDFVIPQGVNLSPGDKSEIRRQARTLTNVENAALKYKNVLSEVGTDYIGAKIGSKKSSRLQQAYKDLTIEAKNLFELGALAKADMELIEGYLPDPTSLRGTTIGAEQLVRNIDDVVKKLDSARNSIARSYDLKRVQPPSQEQQTSQGMQPSSKPGLQSPQAQAFIRDAIAKGYPEQQVFQMAKKTFG